MAETTVTTGEWLAMAVTSVIAGLGWAAAFFRRSNMKREGRIKDWEDDMTTLTELLATHDKELAVIRTNQDHMTKRLEEIRVCGENMNQKIDTLPRILTEMIMAMKQL